MKYSKEEKLEIIRLVEGSSTSLTFTLRELSVSHSTFYDWYRRYAEEGEKALVDNRAHPMRVWNRIPQKERDKVVTLARKLPERSCRELACLFTDKQGYFISESSVYRILLAQGLVTGPVYAVNTAKKEFDQKTSRINEMWQADFTYFKVLDWGWYYLLSVMDDFARYILGWKLYPSMTSDDVKDLLKVTMNETGVMDVPVKLRPNFLSDNGPCFVSKELTEYLGKSGIRCIHGRPYHPQTQGKIERYHRSMKNIILLDHYHTPAELETSLSRWVKYYNNERYHESLGNVTPAQAYYGKAEAVLQRRKYIKLLTLQERRVKN